jgi:hypothetical protein
LSAIDPRSIQSLETRRQGPDGAFFYFELRTAQMVQIMSTDTTQEPGAGGAGLQSNSKVLDTVDHTKSGPAAQGQTFGVIADQLPVLIAFCGVVLDFMKGGSW